MCDKPKVLVVYDYFFPGYKAGGPIQSLTNLIVSLQNNFDFWILTTAYDLQSNYAYNTVNINSWNQIYLPGSSRSVEVWYSDKSQPTYSQLRRLLKEVNPGTLYLNGLYSFNLFILPLIVTRFFLQKKVVVCPRGMLQQGALAVKSNKKKYYIKALQISGLLHHVYWHATNGEELKDIVGFFPKNKGVTIASNVPKKPFKQAALINKKEGELKLVFLSLITEKKNLLLLLKVLEAFDCNVSLDIYGPVKDVEYWDQCQKLINEMREKVKFLGDVTPMEVQDVIANYHAMALLTKGENFGHALYEALSVGRPVITSFYTPWKDLQQQKAGANADILDVENCRNKIQRFVNMNQQEYDLYRLGSHTLAVNYFNGLETQQNYKELFS